MSDEQLKEIFTATDTDGSGKVDKKELKSMVSSCNDMGLFDPKLDDVGITETADVIIAECDEGAKDGKLTLDEFVKGMKKIMG